MLGSGRRVGGVVGLLFLVVGMLAGTGFSASPAAASSPAHKPKHCVPGPGADLRRCNFSRANLAGVNLTGADLEGAKLKRTNLTGADLSGAAMNGVQLSRARLSGADLNEISSGDITGAPASLPAH